MTKQSPRPSRIVRKLTLKKEQLVELAGDTGPKDHRRCTKRQTGCPVHTC